MAAHPGNPRVIRWLTSLSFLMGVVAVPMFSQIGRTEGIRPEHRISDRIQEPVHPPAAEPETVQPSASLSPEELRKTQIEADTKKLYQLCAELRSEVAKTYKESLSISVLKKAEEVEKLAKSLKLLMNKEAATKH